MAFSWGAPFRGLSSTPDKRVATMEGGQVPGMGATPDSPKRPAPRGAGRSRCLPTVAHPRAAPRGPLHGYRSHESGALGLCPPTGPAQANTLRTCSVHGASLRRFAGSGVFGARRSALATRACAANSPRSSWTHSGAGVRGSTRAHAEGPTTVVGPSACFGVRRSCSRAFSCSTSPPSLTATAALREIDPRWNIPWSVPLDWSEQRRSTTGWAS